MPHVSEFRVRYAETDQMGVVYHANYLIWCEVGRTDYIRALGSSYAEVEREGTALAVVDARLRYARSARYDDLIRIVTRVTEVRSRVVTFSYDIRLAESDVPLVTASTVLVAVDRRGRTTVVPSPLRRALECAIEA